MLCPYWTTLMLPLDYFRNIPATSRFTGFRTAEQRRDYSFFIALLESRPNTGRDFQ
jgi:hypothetical protein